MAQYTTGKYPNLASSGVIEHAVDLTAATVTTAGAVVSVANPLGVALIITDAYIDITTAATTGTNTIDAGVAANGTTTSDTLFDGQAASAGLKSPGGTNGAVPRRWGASEYVTATASATLVGMVATLHLVVIRA
jgi:hypothetical protein